MKLIFGSDFAYSKAIDKLNLILKDIEYFPSLAKGGLSNVWGGSILPYKNQEFYNWPIKLKDLENHYKYVLDEVGISCQNDDLKKIFPIYAKSNFCLNNSSQTNILRKEVKKEIDLLKKLQLKNQNFYRLLFKEEYKGLPENEGTYNHHFMYRIIEQIESIKILYKSH